MIKFDELCIDAVPAFVGVAVVVVAVVAGTLVANAMIWLGALCSMYLTVRITVGIVVSLFSIAVFVCGVRGLWLAWMQTPKGWPW